MEERPNAKWIFIQTDWKAKNVPVPIHCIRVNTWIIQLVVQSEPFVSGLLALRVVIKWNERRGLEVTFWQFLTNLRWNFDVLLNESQHSAIRIFKSFAELLFVKCRCWRNIVNYSEILLKNEIMLNLILKNYGFHFAKEGKFPNHET